MRKISWIRLLALALVVGLVAVPVTTTVSANEIEMEALGFVGVDCGEESFLTRVVASIIDGEGSLLWVGGDVDAYLVTDRQGIPTTPTPCNFGAVLPSTTYVTGLSYFTVTNNGEYAIDITIGGTDMTGGTTWELSDTSTPGENVCGLKAGLEGGDYTIVVKKTSPYNTLKSNLGAGGTQGWGLKLYAPTVFGDGVEKSGDVILTVALS